MEPAPMTMAAMEPNSVAAPTSSVREPRVLTPPMSRLTAVTARGPASGVRPGTPSLRRPSSCTSLRGLFVGCWRVGLRLRGYARCVLGAGSEQLLRRHRPGVVSERTGNLLPAVLAHSLFDGLLIALAPVTVL